jgi:hypothetical protein
LALIAHFFVGSVLGILGAESADITRGWVWSEARTFQSI